MVYKTFHQTRPGPEKGFLRRNTDKGFENNSDGFPVLFVFFCCKRMMHKPGLFNILYGILICNFFCQNVIVITQ